MSPKTGPGRPTIGALTSLRLTDELRTDLTTYADRHDLAMGEAIRALLTDALKTDDTTTEPVAAATPDTSDDTRSEIQSTYWQLRRLNRPGILAERVSMTDLRWALPHLSRSDIDAALTELVDNHTITLAPEADQKQLTPADHDAALYLGGQKKHYMIITN